MSKKNVNVEMVPEAESVVPDPPKPKNSRLPEGVTTEMVDSWKAEFGSIYQQTFMSTPYIIRGYTVSDSQEVETKEDPEVEIVKKCVLFPKITEIKPGPLMTGLLNSIQEASGRAHNAYTIILNKELLDQNPEAFETLSAQTPEVAKAAAELIEEQGSAMVFVSESKFSSNLSNMWVFGQVDQSKIAALDGDKLIVEVINSSMRYPKPPIDVNKMLAHVYDQLWASIERVIGLRPTSAPIEL